MKLDVAVNTVGQRAVRKGDTDALLCILARCERFILYHGQKESAYTKLSGKDMIPMSIT